MKKIYVVFRYHLDENENCRRFECAFDSITECDDFVHKMNEVWFPYRVAFDYAIVPLFDSKK